MCIWFPPTDVKKPIIWPIHFSSKKHIFNAQNLARFILPLKALLFVICEHHDRKLTLKYDVLIKA